MCCGYAVTSSQSPEPVPLITAPYYLCILRAKLRKVGMMGTYDTSEMLKHYYIHPKIWLCPLARLYAHEFFLFECSHFFQEGRCQS